MKVLYGVQGTGNGHIARARVMAKALAERSDIQVDFVFSGRDSDKYFDMQVFNDYKTLTGLTFITENGAVNRWKTLKSVKAMTFLRDVKHTDLSGYDLVLNDFEPVTAWAARRQKKPCISVSHQAAFRFPVPKAGDSWSDRFISKYFAPGDIQLGVHWYHFGHSIMPPFIEDKLDVAPNLEHVLVYLPFEELSEIEKLLGAFPEQQFECFHPDLKTNRDQANIKWRKTSKSEFQQSIKHCSGVIANAGFELSSECLQLGKKILLKPLDGQFEQLSNIVTLEHMGMCTSMRQLDQQKLTEWLKLENPPAITFPDDPNPFIDWLLKKDWHNTAEITDLLWRQVKFPAQIEQRLEQIAS